MCAEPRCGLGYYVLRIFDPGKFWNFADPNCNLTPQICSTDVLSIIIYENHFRLFFFDNDLEHIFDATNFSSARKFLP